MMRGALFLLILMASAIAAGVHADDHHDPEPGNPHYAPEGPPRVEDFPDPAEYGSFNVIPLSQAAELVEQRFYGKLIAARLVPPTEWEHDHGVALVHELRLINKKRDVLIIRLDARSGKFLEVAGKGLSDARRPPRNIE